MDLNPGREAGHLIMLATPFVFKHLRLVAASQIREERKPSSENIKSEDSVNSLNAEWLSEASARRFDTQVR
jgi:hypothetical protein